MSARICTRARVSKPLEKSKTKKDARKKERDIINFGVSIYGAWSRTKLLPTSLDFKVQSKVKIGLHSKNSFIFHNILCLFLDAHEH
jgi:hypothetical protein